MTDPYDEMLYVWNMYEISIYSIGECGPDQFQCNDGKCISSKKKCDSRIDCVEREDETACKVENGMGS